MSALTSRIAATLSTSSASRVARPRGAARLPTRAASDVTVATAPSTSTAPSPAWTEAWRSVQDPSTRVAYIDDAPRAALRAALEAGGLAEALETVEAK